MRVLFLASLLTLICTGTSHGQSRRLMGSLREDLMASEAKLRASKEHEKRILELRIRHDLGLPVRAGRYLSLTEQETEALRYADPSILAEEENETRRLARQLASLQDQIEAAGGNPEAEVFTPVELPAKPGVRSEQPRPQIELPAEEPDILVPAQPGLETQARGFSLSSEGMGGELHLIKGSPDRAEIGRVLLHYGETLDARAELLANEGDSSEAEKHRQLAKREYLRAKQELDPLVWQENEGKLSRKLRDEVELPVMFLLAQCEEKLGNYGVASEIYLDIKNLDKVKDEAGNNDLGSWGLAADVARRVMEFMLEHGEWAPVPAINSIQWPGK